MDSPRDRNNLLYLQSTNLNTVRSVCLVFVSTSLLPKLRDLKPPCHCTLDLTLHLMTTEGLCIPPWFLTPQSRSPQISRALSFKAFFSVKLWSMVPSAFVFPQSSWFFEHLQSNFPNHWTGPQVTMTCSLPSHVSPLVSILLSLPESHTHAGLTFRSLSRNRLSHGEEAWRWRIASLEKCPPGESAAWLGWEANRKLPKPQIICSYTVSLGNVLLRKSSWWLSACFLSLFLSCSSFHNSCALLTSGRSYCSSWGIIHYELCLSLGPTPMQFPSESQTQLCPGSAVPCLIIKFFCPRCSSNPKKIKIENILLLSPTSVYANIGWGLCDPVHLWISAPRAWKTSSQRASCMLTLIHIASSFTVPKAWTIQVTPETCMGGRKVWAVHT